jgi:hypothetical protein
MIDMIENKGQTKNPLQNNFFILKVQFFNLLPNLNHRKFLIHISL